MPKAAKRTPQKIVKRAIPKSHPRRKIVTDKDKTDTKRADYPLAEQGQPKDPVAGGGKGAFSETTSVVPPADMLTEQEKDVVGTGGTDVTAGVGPTTPAEHTTGPVETIEDQGIGPRTPYPSGGAPPPPEADATKKKGPGK